MKEKKLAIKVASVLLEVQHGLGGINPICDFCLEHKKEECEESSDCGRLIVQAVEEYLKIQELEEA